ncbi:MAG TPA: phospholipase D family protein [Casimicrobiaceae bacterium]|nr:phospholipase D family protein [Casimicrobiaceae bacterium]
MRRTAWSLIAIAFLALLAGCATLPSLEGRGSTLAFADTAQTRLGRAVANGVAAHPGKTGIHAVPNPHDAFAARVLLAAAAERSIDAQYYIWHGDQVGYLLFEALWRAAERGVRVRLLLDDVNTRGLDPTIVALDAHPNIEVRLYNPLLQRGLRALNFVTDFARVNRRMHNKSFTVDNQVAIVGGRNIGNEYFAAGDEVAFTDLDVVAVGAAVPEVSREFDAYWNSASAYPAAEIVGARGAADLAAKFASIRMDAESITYIDAVRDTPMVQQLLDRTLDFEWTPALVLHDDPAKTVDDTARIDTLLFPELQQAMGRPQRSLDLVSPYFVPGDAGMAALVAVAGRGVRVRVLTNSLSSTDVTAIHAGYGPRRIELLRAGVKLYELKATRPPAEHEDTSGIGSSGAAALHAKTFAVDGERIFVGSFNLDQRSARLNTEMGLVIESAILAQRLTDTFDTIVPQLAYEVRLLPDGRSLEWIERTAAGEIRYDTEPHTTWWRRSKVDVLSILPIDWLL